MVMKGKVFNTQEVQSIILGDKTMFREVINSPILQTVKLPKENYPETYFYVGNGYVKCPYQVGQKISCKERWLPNNSTKWKPAQSMPQWASRLTLQIKEIKVERLAEISRGDCMTEGCPFPNIAKETNPKEWFVDNWNATHKKPEEKFEANPWVWVVEFEVINN